MGKADRPIRKLLLQAKIDAVVDRRRRGQAVNVIAAGLEISQAKVKRVLLEVGMFDGEDLTPKRGKYLKKPKANRCPQCGAKITTKECIGCDIADRKRRWRA